MRSVWSVRVQAISQARVMVRVETLLEHTEDPHGETAVALEFAHWVAVGCASLLHVHVCFSCRVSLVGVRLSVPQPCLHTHEHNHDMNMNMT